MQIVGLSILSGAHVALTQKTADALRAAGADDVLLVVGGTIPKRDVPRLEAAGAAAVYPTGTPLEELVESMRALATVETGGARGPSRLDCGIGGAVLTSRPGSSSMPKVLNAIARQVYVPTTKVISIS